MKRRVDAGHPALSGMFTRAEVTYAWPRADGTVVSDREPVALFTSEAVHTYLGHLSNAAIEEMLNELATELGAALGQERIYVAFADRTWILDAGQHGSDECPGTGGDYPQASAWASSLRALRGTSGGSLSHGGL
jgi:hypothetical protein